MHVGPHEDFLGIRIAVGGSQYPDPHRLSGDSSSRANSSSSLTGRVGAGNVTGNATGADARRGQSAGTEADVVIVGLNSTAGG